MKALATIALAAGVVAVAVFEPRFATSALKSSSLK